MYSNEEMYAIFNALLKFCPTKNLFKHLCSNSKHHHFYNTL